LVIQIIINLALALAICAFLYRQHATHVSFSARIFTGLGLGIALGAAMHLAYGANSPVIAETNAYLDIIGSGYVKLLQMIVMPLIMVSIVGAILKLKGANSLGKISVLTIGTLMLTTMVAAAVGIGMAKAFGLTAVGLTAAAAEVALGEVLQGSLATAKAVTLPSLILSFIPSNPFLDMTGGLAGIGVAEKKPQIFASFENFVNVAQAIVMRVVTMVLRLTPYGIFALMTQLVADASYADIIKLGSFVLASYGAILIMFAVHLALITGAGLNPVRYVKTSVGAIPMNVQTQTQRLGTPDGIANFAASFGSTIGQNGCAGIYPAMLAVMIAPTVGIDPFTPGFIAQLIFIVTIGSVGVAGVGGGATFAALIVLSAMDLPVALAGLLISVEPLIDMGRTALNVSGSITAGTVTSRILGQTDMGIFNSEVEPEWDGAKQAA
jgi:uncharacterized protein